MLGEVPIICYFFVIDEARRIVFVTHFIMILLLCVS